MILLFISAIVAVALNAPTATVIVATIVGTTGILTARIQNLKRSNHEEHDINHKLLLEIQGDVQRTERKIDDHMAFHAHGAIIRVVDAKEVEVKPPVKGGEQ